MRLGRTQREIMRLLERYGPLSVHELWHLSDQLYSAYWTARKCAVSRGYPGDATLFLWMALKRLEQRGLVERTDEHRAYYSTVWKLK